MPLDRAISIHALREEGDIIPSGINPRAARFLSTPSARRATSSRKKWQRPEMISIHALREEGDNKHTVEETKTQ